MANNARQIVRNITHAVGAETVSKILGALAECPGMPEGHKISLQAVAAILLIKD